MSRTLQFKRYANTQVANTTGANGELIIDSTNHTITVHDGVTVGGTRLATELFVANSANSLVTLGNIIFYLAQASYNQANLAYLFAITQPQNAQSSSYVLSNTDAGKHIYYTNSTNVNLYIPSSSTTNFANGTLIKVISHSTSNVTVTPNSGVSLYSAGNSTPGIHNVTSYGVATLQIVAANTWYIYGLGIN